MSEETTRPMKNRVVLPLLQKVKVVNWLDKNRKRIPEITADDALASIKEEEGVDMIGIGMDHGYCKTLLKNLLTELGVEQGFRWGQRGRRHVSNEVVELQEGIRCIAHVLTVVVKELDLVKHLNGHFDRLYQISRRGVEQGEEVTT